MCGVPTPKDWQNEPKVTRDLGTCLVCFYCLKALYLCLAALHCAFDMSTCLVKKICDLL